MWHNHSQCAFVSPKRIAGALQSCVKNRAVSAACVAHKEICIFIYINAPLDFLFLILCFSWFSNWNQLVCFRLKTTSRSSFTFIERKMSPAGLMMLVSARHPLTHGRVPHLNFQWLSSPLCIILLHLSLFARSHSVTQMASSMTLFPVLCSLHLLQYANIPKSYHWDQLQISCMCFTIHLFESSGRHDSW